MTVRMMDEFEDLRGLEVLRRMIAAGGKPAIGETLDFVFKDAGHGWALFAGFLGLKHYNPLGTVHGGYAATLLDSACGCAVHSKLEARQFYTTLELKISYHVATTDASGVLRAMGRAVKVGRRAAFSRATLTGSGDRLHASATTTLLVF